MLVIKIVKLAPKRQFFGEKNFNVFMLPGSLHDLLSIMEGETPLMVVIGTTFKRSSCSYWKVEFEYII